MMIDDFILSLQELKAAYGVNVDWGVDLPHRQIRIEVEPPHQEGKYGKTLFYYAQLGDKTLSGREPKHVILVSRDFRNSTKINPEGFARYVRAIMEK